MPTMSINNRSVVLISLVAFLWFGQVSFAQLQPPLLHPDEADALRRIATTLGATLENPTEDPCLSKKLSVTANYSETTDAENIIGCNYIDGNFYHVTNIRLKSMSLQGRLPPDLVNLTFLREIDLTRNYLGGELPKQWTSLRNLNRIWLTANRLSGEIPSEWGYFTNLTQLSLEANQLSGTIPEELGNLVTLTDLILSSNQFVGSLPITLANLTNLQNFRISDNSFNGTVPNFIGTWSKLQRLEMYSSGIEGPIDPMIFKLGNLNDLRITDMIGPKFQFPKLISKTMEVLVLRNLNMSGSIPTDIWDKVKTTLDLTFNKLEGGIAIDIPREDLPNYMFLSGNMLNGTIPESILSNTKLNFDLSYNNFTSSPPSTCPKIRSGLQPCHHRSSCQKYYDSIHINCGGPDVLINHTWYEGDNDAENGNILNHDRGTKWGFISAGDFMDDDGTNGDGYVVSADTQPGLYSKARASPLFLTYYGYCLDNGNYTVNLHFMEILFKDGEPYHRVGRRIFDIYIQGTRKLKDFNIKEQANETGKAIIKTFNTTVTDNTLDIRLYWAGKGTTCIPSRGIYGPLISAISVCRGFNATCDEFKPHHGEGKKKTVTIGVAVAVVGLCLIILMFGILYWRQYSRTKPGREQDHTGLNLQTSSFTLKEIKAATNNFDPVNKIGEGGFGPVYKGLLSDGTIIAVKQLSSKSRQGNREFLNEIGMFSCLQHPNLVKLYGCCIEKDQLLLVYEYMENNSLARALFDCEKFQLKLDWPTRRRICLGIAKGLAFIHEESRFKIVHRDIKPTNVLLDKNLNPKISDFGLAKLDEEEKTHISTRIAGTVGYMAPEYALWGYLTYKADVYSFGIVALEIISGKNNMSYVPAENCYCVLDWAFHLHQNEKLMELVDQNLGFEFDKNEAERMIKVALLCANASPSLRPTMSEVVNMLEGTTPFPDAIPEAGSYSEDMKFKALRDKRMMMTRNQAPRDPPSTSSSSGPSSSTLDQAHCSGSTSSSSSLSSTCDVGEVNAEKYLKFKAMRDSRLQLERQNSMA